MTKQWVAMMVAAAMASGGLAQGRFYSGPRHLGNRGGQFSGATPGSGRHARRGDRMRFDGFGEPHVRICRRCR